MKTSCRAAVVVVATLSVALLRASVSAHAQAPAQASADHEAAAERAKRLAEQFEALARVLTVFDRQGKVVTTVGERALYFRPVFSPDRTRLAVVKRDLESATEDVWVLEVATGHSTRITSSQTREFAGSPAWSPNGRQVAYAALRGSYWGLYRRASNGAGPEELLYRHAGVIVLSDWSMDGRFLTFFSTDLSGGVLYALPLGGDAERTPVEVVRSQSRLQGPHLSPDTRFMSYQSNRSGKDEVYVRPFDASTGPGATPTAGPWQVSDEGSQSLLFWRRDGREMYYFAADRGVMAVKFMTAPTFKFGTPKLLFRLPEAVPVTPELSSVSRDGERIVIAVPHAPTLQQITIFDREGHVLRTVGEPGRYGTPALSQDGTRVAVVRIDPRTNIRDVWAFDVASGRGTRITNDFPSTNSTLISPISPIWSPDGSHVAFVSTRGNFTGIYRRASDGTGVEEHLFQHTPGAWMVLTDWSADGEFLTFYSGGVLSVVPLDGDRTGLERKAIEWLRDEYEVSYGLLSPDSTLMAYVANAEVYLRPFDARKPDAGAGSATPVRVSRAGARAAIFWRQDGKEMYYLTPDWQVMAVDVTSTGQVGTPRLLFKLPGATGNPREWVRNVSRDGQRFVFTVSVPVSVTAR